MFVLLLVLGAYSYGRSGRKQVPREGYRLPRLRELVVTAKFSVVATSVVEVHRKLMQTLNPHAELPFWTGTVQGNFIELHYGRPQEVEEWIKQPLLKWHWRKPSPLNLYYRTLLESRSGIPMNVTMIGSYSSQGAIDFDVTVLPNLYYWVYQLKLLECTSQQIEEAQHECCSFADQLRGMLGGAELQAPQVSAVGPATDVRRKLTRYGLDSQADLLTQAEMKIMGGQVEDGVKNCRSAVEQVTEKLIIRNGLHSTNTFANNITSLESNKYLDPRIGEFLRRGLYAFLSSVAHDKYAPTPRVAEYVLAVTEETVAFLLDRLS